MGKESSSVNTESVPEHDELVDDPENEEADFFYSDSHDPLRRLN